MKTLHTANSEILELTPERENRLRSALADLYYSDPKSYDVTEAIMNRIMALELRLANLESVRS